MIDHRDKPLPKMPECMTIDQVQECPRLTSGTCAAYVSRPGGSGERTQYQCRSDDCGRRL